MIPDVAPENREKSPLEDLTSVLASDTVLGSKKKGKEKAPCLKRKVQTCCARKDLSAARAGEVEITPHGQPLQPKGLVDWGTRARLLSREAAGALRGARTKWLVPSMRGLNLFLLFKTYLFFTLFLL